MTRQEYIYVQEIEKLRKKLKQYEKNKVRRGDVVYLKYNKEDYRLKYSYMGRRPYLVVSNDKGNKASPTCIVVPMTSKDKRPDLLIHSSCSYHGSTVCCEGIKVIDQEEVEDIRYHLSEEEMDNVNKCLKVLLSI